jgi:protocatechuate 3,4-dioxygenase beta subunit
MNTASQRRLSALLAATLAALLVAAHAAGAAQTPLAPQAKRTEQAPRQSVPISGRAVDREGRVAENRVAENIVAKLLPAVDAYRRGRIELGLENLPEPVATATADAAGRFLVAAPGPGLWVLELASAELSSGGHFSRQSLLVSEELELGAVRVARWRRVEVVVRTGGTPVPGARVVPASAQWADLPAVAQPATTDAQGRTELLVPFDETDSGGTLLVLADGHAVAQRPLRSSRIEVALQPGALRKLRVLDEGSRPVAAAVVRAAGAAVGLTDAEGRVELRVEPKELHVSLLSSALGAATLRLRGVTPSATSHQPDPASPRAPGEPRAAADPERVVHLKAPVVVEGRVVEKETKAPVADAIVTNVGWREASATTDPSGRFELRFAALGQDTLAPLEARKPGYATGLWYSPGMATGRAVAAIELARARELRGVVVDRTERPVAGAEVVLEDQDFFRVTRASTAARTDEAGAFHLAVPLATPSTTLVVRHPDFATLRHELGEAELVAGSARLVLGPGWLATGWVLDGESRGIAGARVELAEFGGQERPPWQEEPAAGHAGTGDDGRFAFERVASGRYTLRVEREGYAPALVPGVEVADGSGETELGTITLQPGVVVEGVVLGPERTPIADVELRLGGGRQAPARSAWSDVEGRFAFADLAPGTELEVRARREGWVESRKSVAVRADATPLEIVMQPGLVLEGVVVDADGAEIAEATLRLVPSAPGTAVFGMGGRAHSAADGTFSMDGLAAGTYRLFAGAPGFQPATLEGMELRAEEDRSPLRVELLPGAVVTGRVTDAEGEPVSGAFVWHRNPRSRDPYATPSQLRPIPSDAEGRYQLEGLPAGRVELEAQARGYRSQVRESAIEPGENEIDFALVRAPEIHGRVIDEDGRPVAAALVMVAVARASRGDRSDAEGSFRIAVELGSIVRVSASKDGLGTSEEVGLEVRDAPLPELVLQLRRGATLRGRVEGLELDALARTTVAATPLSAQRSTQRNFGFGGARPDYEGRFHLDDLQPGRWLIGATDRTTGRTVEEVVDVEPGTAELEVTLRFDAGATLSGVVLSSGETVAEARLQARGLDVSGAGSARTDSQGAFRFEDLMPGTYQLVVEAPGRSLPHREPVEVGGDTEVTIELPALSLAGRVVSAESGAPLGGAAVSLALRERMTFEGGPLRTRGDHRAGADGAFRFDGLVPGVYTIEASAPDHASRVVEVRVDDAAAEEAVIELEPSTGLVLRVTGPLGLPVPRVVATVRNDAGAALLTRPYLAGEDGRIVARDLPRGRQFLLLSDGDAFAELETEVPGEELAVQLQRGGYLEITAPELAGGGGRYLVELERPGAPARAWFGFVPPMRHGFTRVGPVPAGAWTVRVHAGDRELVGSAVVESGRTVAVELR